MDFFKWSRASGTVQIQWFSRFFGFFHTRECHLTGQSVFWLEGALEAWLQRAY